MLTTTEAQALAQAHGTPLFVYNTHQLAERANQLASLVLPFGFTPRYAIKANPHPTIVRLFSAAGLQFDASSSYEADFLLTQGVTGHHISLSSQQPAHNLPHLLASGVRFTATSLHQLRLFAAAASRGSQLGLRVNPGSGSGHNNRTTTGGASSSFGLWHEYISQALRLARQHGLHITTLHIHIGSGGDPATWSNVMALGLQIAERMPHVTTLNLGGGFKVRRWPGEAEADLPRITRLFARQLRNFARQTGRQVHLELEPGTWLVAHAGTLLAQVTDIVDTGPQGFRFLRLNTGMNDILRPTLYGAQHNIRVLNTSTHYQPYVVVGHNCETGDILTPAPHDPEHIQPRRLRTARIGDLVAIADTGAYCAAMRAHGYNAFPSAPEVFV